VHTLVTGGAGFLGAALVERLLAEGHTVDVVDNLSAGSLWNLAEARATAGRNLTFHQLDVRSPDVADLIARRRPEVVWHLAGQADLTTGISGPVADAQTNVVGALGVVEGVRSAGSRKLVVTSSAAVYGEAGGRPVTESHARRPLSPHGVAKHAVDAYLAVYASVEAIRFTSLVLGTVYGPRCASGVVATWADCLVAGQPCVVFGDSDQVRDFVYVDDVVDALARAADGGDGMVLNVGTGTPTSLAELHAVMVEIVGRLGPADGDERGPALGLRHAERRPGEPRAVVLDPARAAAALEWCAWTPLEEGLEAVVEARLAPAPRRPSW
jgi:UDP-glucose 4-epimerase